MTTSEPVDLTVILKLVTETRDLVRYNAVEDEAVLPMVYFRKIWLPDPPPPALTVRVTSDED